MRKDIRRCDSGDEKLLPIFVFLAALMTCIIVLTAGVTEMAAENVPTAYYEDKTGWDWVGGIEVEYATPTYGYNLTYANFTTHSDDDSANQKFIFDIAGFHWIALRFVKDYDEPNFERQFGYMSEGDDFVSIHIEKDEAIIDDDKWRSIDFDNLFPHWLSDNTSYATFTAWDYNFSVIITTPSVPVNESTGNPHADHINSFWLGSFNVKIARIHDLSDNAMKSSMWIILGQILTLQMPDVNPIVQMLVSIPIWAGIGFFFFTVLSRVMPFISGG